MGVKLVENSSTLNELEKKPGKYIRSKFGGIKFLWKTPKFRLFIKLMILLLISMVVLNGILYFLFSIFGRMNLILITIELISDAAFLGLFLYLMIDLIIFYRNSKKYKLFPEKNKYLQMKYWSSIETKSQKKLRKKRVILLLGIIVITIFIGVVPLYLARVNLLLIFSMILFGTLVFLYYSSLLIIGILAFMATKGMMESFENRYSEKFHRKWYWSVLLLPIPWLISIFIIYNYYYIRLFDDIVFSRTMGVLAFIYLALGIIGFLALFKRNWRSGFTVSHISATLTILSVIIIPFFIGIVIDIMGTIVSFIALVFFFVLGTLNENGNELNEYFEAWDNKLKNFNIKSEQDIQSQNYDKSFESTPLTTDVPNAVCDLAIGLIVLTYTLFVFLHLVMKSLLLSGETGILMISIILYFISIVESFAIISAIIIFTIIIILRQAKKDVKERTKTLEVTSYLICPNCKQNVEHGKFCEKCGAKLLIECPFCKQIVNFGKFCEKCGAQISIVKN